MDQKKKRSVLIFLLASSVILAQWIHFVCLVNGAVHHKMRIGRTELVEAGKEVGKGKAVEHRKNVVCTKTIFPHIHALHGLLNTSIYFGEKLEFGEIGEQVTLSMMSINHHGKGHLLDASSVVSGFTIVNRDYNLKMLVCVHREPAFEDDTFGIKSFKGIHVDWLLFRNRITAQASTVHRHESNLDITNRSLLCIPFEVEVEIKNSKHPIRTILASIQFESDSFVYEELAVWIDAITESKSPPLSSYIITACVKSSNYTDDLDDDLDDDFVGPTLSIIALIGKHALHDGIPPKNLYVTEYGHMALSSRPLLNDEEDVWVVLCIDKSYDRVFRSTPYVFVSISYRKNQDKSGIPITGWVEFINEEGFRACASRPRFSDMGKLQSDVYVEYLLISVDGIFDETDIADAALHLGILVTLELTEPAFKFIEDFKKHRKEFAHFWEAISNASTGSFIDGGFANPPIFPQGIVLMGWLYMDTWQTVEKVEDAFNKFFELGRFPFDFNVTANSSLIANMIYPNGPPNTTKEAVLVAHDFVMDCLPTPFSSAKCSVPLCGTETDGTKVLKRVVQEGVDPRLCPHRSIEVRCNLPPCNVRNKKSFYVLDKDTPKPSSKLFLWVVLFALLILNATWGIEIIWRFSN